MNFDFTKAIELKLLTMGTCLSTAQKSKQKDLQNQVRLLVLGYIRMFIQNVINNDIPIEVKLICKDFAGGLIVTKILTINEESLLLKYVKQQTKSEWICKLIHRGSNNGFKKASYL